MAAWKLPLVVSAIALPIIAGFYVGGPGLGMAVGALAAATIIVLAVRKPPLEQFAIAPSPDAQPRLLVVLNAALEASGAVAVAALVGDAALAGTLPEVLLIAPCRSNFAERWTSDLEAGRQRAGADLSGSAAALAKLGIAASTRVGDENTVQMTEDTLRSFAATELILIDGKGGGRTADELQSRLVIPFHRARATDGGTGTRSASRQPGMSIQRTIRPLRTS
jgi:hypothetical protein